MKRIVFLLVAVVMTANVNAQSKWGESVADSVICYDNYNIFGSFYQSKDYAGAFEPWLKVYQTCPAAKKALCRKEARMWWESTTGLLPVR